MRLLWIPLLVLLERPAGRPAWHWPDYAGLALTVGLLIVPFELATRFSDGWAALAAYPRLYAAWLLWALTLRQGGAVRTS